MSKKMVRMLDRIGDSKVSGSSKRDEGLRRPRRTKLSVVLGYRRGARPQYFCA